MPNVDFRPNLTYRHPLLWPATLFRANVPAGLPSSAIRAPIYVSAEEIQRLSPSRTIRVVGGLTRREFAVRFADIQQQWQRVSRGGTSPWWQFQGGTVYWDLNIGVYVAQGFRNYQNILAVIMEHELLHVFDEIDIVRNYMGPQARRDEYVRRYLLEGNPVDDSMFQRWFRGRGFSDWIRNGIWAPETNRRTQRRDSGPEWERYRQRIDQLMRAAR